MPYRILYNTHWGANECTSRDEVVRRFAKRVLPDGRIMIHLGKIVGCPIETSPLPDEELEDTANE